jgi:radical SAM-linked protein
VSGPAASPDPEPVEPPPNAAAAEPRQRWRLVVGRSADAPAEAHREVTGSWTAALVSTDLPIARAAGPGSRPRITFGAPLPVGMAAEGELIDVVLVERWPVWRVREAIEDRVPQGWRLVDLYDVWLAGPPLAGRVAAADYRVTLRDSVGLAAIDRASAALLAAPRLPRERVKGGERVAYDLRPLLIGIDVRSGPPPTLSIRTRFHPELGTGRPDEVLGALGEAAGMALEPLSIVRERLLLAEDEP